MAPKYQAASPIKVVAIKPRIKISSPFGNSAVTSLTKASLTTMPLAEVSIATMPRRLSFMRGRKSVWRQARS